MLRLTPTHSVLVILSSYLLTAAVVAVMVLEAIQGRWHTLVFGAGCIFGFLAGLRVGLPAEEQAPEVPPPFSERHPAFLENAELPVHRAELPDEEALHLLGPGWRGERSPGGQ